MLTADDEAEFATGTTRPTTEHLDDLIDSLTDERSIGRAAVLFDECRTPALILFWGFSGD